MKKEHVRQCLNRRIPTIEQMEREILTLVQERERKATLINWQLVSSVNQNPNCRLDSILEHLANEVFLCF